MHEIHSSFDRGPGEVGDAAWSEPSPCPWLGNTPLSRSSARSVAAAVPLADLGCRAMAFIHIRIVDTVPLPFLVAEVN